MKYLIIFIESLEITLGEQVSHNLITQPNAVVKVTKPDHRVMIRNCSILLETQAPVDCFIISISFIVIGKPRCQMRCNQANAGIGDVKPNGTSTLVSGNSRQPCLFYC